MITKVINVNLHQPIYERLTAKQGDIASRYLLFHLLDGDKPFDLSNRTVRVYAIKPDKTEIFNDLTINDASKGYCTLELTSQCLASAGVVKMELYISESGKVLTSIPFELEVIACINTVNSVTSTNEFSALEVALSSLQDYDNLRSEIVQARKGYGTVGKRLDTKAKKGKNIRIIAKENGDYSTINDAIAAGGDTLENPLTLLLCPGTYKEYVYIKQWSRINLVGTNRKDCIVKTTEGDYLKPPLETCGERYIANITFVADHSETAADPNTLGAYAFHGDKSSGGDGTTLIENCRFESYQNASVGLGIYNNQKFHFKNCEFYSKINYDSPQSNVGAFFAHNNVAGGTTNGELILENCDFFMDNDRAGYGHACYINDANLTDGDGSGNAINVKFINCTLRRRNGFHVDDIRLDNTTSINNLSGSITLDKISYGNNIACLNFPQLTWYGVTLTLPIENVGSNFAPLRYSKDITGKVRIEGTIKGLTSGSTNTLFTLPIKYRPKYHKFYDIVNYSGSTIQIGKLLVNRNGDVTIEGTLNTVRTDICVEFYAEE